ncbi:hypothetical protein SCLCIDRAFT_135629, partial [Scleroderma citrinum Foug A]
QSLMASPPSLQHPNGRYDFTIISQTDKSDWPSVGLTGHAVVQIRLISCLLRSSTFFAYVQRFNHTFPPLSYNTTDGAAGLHGLKRVIRHNGMRVGEVIPLHCLCSPAHVIPLTFHVHCTKHVWCVTPRFGKEANQRLTCHTAYELSNEFWLNKYWNKEIFYALST